MKLDKIIVLQQNAKYINETNKIKMPDLNSIRLIYDKYDGVIIDSSSINENVEAFEEELLYLLTCLENKKLLWIKLPIEKSPYIPMLTRHAFVFHHCNERDIMLVRRLVDNPTMPTATNHTVGVGAVVTDADKLLVIKDRFWQVYKLPGGHVDDRENISSALVREVYEETGIHVEFESIISLGHFSPGQFNESNLYIVCKAVPLSKEIHIIDSEEILEARWIAIDAYLTCDDVHEYNKKIVRTALASVGLRRSDDSFFSKPGSSREYFFH